MPPCLPLQNIEIAMLGEVTHLQAIVDDLTVLTEDPHKLPPASEQVTHFRLIILPATMTKHYKNMWGWMASFNYSSCSVLPAACPKFLISNCHMSLQVIRDLKGSDYSWSYQTPPSSPSSTGSRKSSMCRYSPIAHTHAHLSGFIAYGSNILVTVVIIHAVCIQKCMVLISTHIFSVT